MKKKRNSIIGEYDLENKLKLLEEHKKHEEDMEYKKNNLSLKSLTKDNKIPNILMADDLNPLKMMTMKKQACTINISELAKYPTPNLENMTTSDKRTRTRNRYFRKCNNKYYK